MGTLTRQAPAKLNLYLHIEGRRADGYHRMESLVVFTQLADTLTMEVADALSLIVDGEFADASGGGESNLVLKAARALQAHTGCAMGARMSLTKNIPVGAGLGGGSADAAAGLRGLNELWGLKLSDDDVRAIGLTLGADVPMCLMGLPAIARGIGEVLEVITLPLPALHVLLVHPRAALLTKDVYAAYAAHPADEAMRWSAMFNDRATLLASLRVTRNHLQAAAVRVNPIVAEVLLALETVQPAADFVRMTGSGACCFALYSNADDAKAAQRQLARDYPEWWCALSTIRP